MNFKNNVEKVKDFTQKRLIEAIGILLLILSILIFVALISYSPTDPNFIYPKNQEINNILGINGSIGANANGVNIHQFGPVECCSLHRFVFSIDSS